MTEDDVQTPGTEGAGEATDTTEEKQETADTQSDPLDDIQDPVARADAKAARAIARRSIKKDDKEGKNEKPEASAPAPSQSVASKEELAVVVTNQAFELASPEVKEHWNDLLAIPLGGFNPMDARSIAANMAERLVILKAKPSKDNPTKEITSSPGIRGTTGTPPSGEVKDRFKAKVADADSWGS
jgi:hypothetical protein